MSVSYAIDLSRPISYSHIQQPKWLVYDVEFENEKVKAFVIDSQAVAHRRTAEFKQNQKKETVMLIMSGINQCLIFLLSEISILPSILRQMKNDNSICFVGMKLGSKNPPRLKVYVPLESPIGGIGYITDYMNFCDVNEVSDLAAKVTQKPNLCKCIELDKEVSSLTGATSKFEKADLANKVTIHYQAKVFSVEEIKYLIHEAYTVCRIGVKLLEFLDAK